MLSEKALNAVYAKVKAKFGKRIKEKEFIEMASLGSVGDIADYLRTKTKFGDTLSNFTSAVWHRGNLERLLRKSSLLENINLCSYEKKVGRHLFRYLLLKSEIDELIKFLRYLAAGHPEEYILLMSYTVNRFVELDLKKLGSVRSKNELMVFLGGTIYEKYLLSMLRDSKNDEINITDIEARLDRMLFETALEIVNEGFSGSQKEELLSLLTLKAELSDIETIFRVKSYYNQGADYIRTLLIGVRGLLTRAQVNEMLEAKDGNAVMDVLRTTRYAKYFKDFDGFTAGRVADKILLQKLTRLIHFSLHPATVMLSYIMYLDIEIDDITHVIEGVRYQLSQEEIVKMLLIAENRRG